jgi:hypothetical protein
MRRIRGDLSGCALGTLKLAKKRSRDEVVKKKTRSTLLPRNAFARQRFSA